MRPGSTSLPISIRTRDAYFGCHKAISNAGSILIAPAELANTILNARRQGHMHDVDDVRRVATDLGY